MPKFFRQGSINVLGLVLLAILGAHGLVGSEYKSLIPLTGKSLHHFLRNKIIHHVEV